jgi:Ser/Thr protein kinase RdoA (MazF antagonist)
MVFYYGSYGFRDDAEKLAYQFKQFIAGYNEVSHFDPVWLNYIPAFLMLRRLDLYARVHTDIPKDEWDHFCQGVVDGVLELRRTGGPFLPLDFTTLIDQS